MTWEIAFTLILLVVLLGAFIWEKIPTELTAMSAFALLLVLGLLTPSDAMGVFSNPGPPRWRSAGPSTWWPRSWPSCQRCA